jgi:hypothetical protein
LIIDLDAMAKKYNLALRNIAVDDAVVAGATAPGKVVAASVGQFDATANKYGTRGVRFSVMASYDTFLQFLHDIQDSLRLLDVTNISFSSTDAGLYDFSVTMKTYWLK